MHKRKYEFDGVLGAAPASGRPGADAAFPRADLSLSVTEDLAALETSWRALERLERNSLHQGYDWCSAWFSARFSAQGSRPAIVTGAIGEEVVFILPLEIVRSYGIRLARLAGGRFNNVNTGLFSASFPCLADDALSFFTGRLKAALGGRADLLLLDNVPLEWNGVRHPLAGLAATESPNHSFQLPLLSSFEKTIAQLNARHRRKKFRAQTRKLEDLGGFTHISPSTGAEKHALLDLFFRQKSKRLTTLGLPDVFSLAETRAFFHRLLDAPSEGADTPLVLHAIRLQGQYEGHIAAIAGLSRKGPHVICQFGSIDESVCPHASPGELLFWLVIEEACRQGASVFDFGLGDQPYKRGWCTQETVQHDILLPLSGMGTLVRPALVALSHTKSAIKRNPRLYALVQRWRMTTSAY